MKIILVMMSFLTILSCSVTPKEAVERQTYYVERKGAYLPVYTLGPNNSDKIVLFVHGGPGLSSVTYYYMPFIQRLAKHYKIFLWDQRGASGVSGVVSPDTMSIPDFVEDMNVVYKSIKTQHPKAKIYLLAHSYGGMVGAAYASKYGNQIAGSIFVSPLLNVPALFTEVPPLMKLTLDKILDSSLLSDKDRNMWVKMRKFYDRIDLFNVSHFILHSDYSLKVDDFYNRNALDAYVKNVLSSIILDNILINFDLDSQRKNTLSMLLKNGEIQRNLETDMNFNLSKITHPVLMSTGKLDLVVPEHISISSYAKMNNGIPNTRSKRVSFENVSHHGLVHSSEKQFFDETTNFIHIN